MKKGFTLIELLATITLLGVLVLIAYPKVNETIENSRKEALEETKRAIINAANKYSVENDKDMDSSGYILISTLIQEGSLENKTYTNPLTGEELDGCVKYKWNETTRQYIFEWLDECKEVIDDTPPTIVIQNKNGEINLNGWAKKDFYVQITTTNADGYNYCISSSKCEPNTYLSAPKGTVIISSQGDNYVCAQAINAYNSSEVICSDLYKLDKTNPTVGDITISGTKGENDWYITDVAITTSDGGDDLSGHDRTTVSPSSITSNTIGINVIATTYDKAGNLATNTIRVKVDKDSPTITAKQDSITLAEGENSLISNYFAVGYSTSGGSVSCDYENANLLNAGNHTVTCTATGGNGKEASSSINVTINEAAPPTVAIQNKNGEFNENGWANKNFYVEITTTNANGYNYCMSSTECEPSTYLAATTGTAMISSQGNNYVCAQAMNSKKTSDVVCSELYKLDTIAPTITANQSNITIAEGKSNIISDYFTVKYSISGGSLSCSYENTAQLSAGTHTVTCTATGGSGKTATASISVTVNKTYICQRAVVLHTETCAPSYSDSQNKRQCAGSKGTKTITYGNLGTGSALTSGDAFDCDINGDGNYDPGTERFYYLSGIDGDDTSEYAVLIYYNNTTLGVADNTSASEIAYDSSGDNWYGPRTAIKNLPKTNQWTNVSLSSVTRAIITEEGTKKTYGGTLPTAFSYSGYATRFVTAQEINSACNITVDGLISEGELEDSCEYLLENTQYAFGSDSDMNGGYWLETPDAGRADYAFYVNSYYRYVYTYLTDFASYGVRPVIEVLKSDIATEIEVTTFTLDSTTYSVPTGMTWDEFAQSYYNTTQYGESIINYTIQDSSGNSVSGDDQIQDGGTYKYKEVTFTFEGTQYTTIEGMTWNEWGASAYNTSLYGISYAISDSDGTRVSSTDEIQANTTYEYILSAFSIYYDGDYNDYTAPEGMTWYTWIYSSYNTTSLTGGYIETYYDIHDETDGKYVSLDSTIEDSYGYAFETNEQWSCENEGGYWTSEGEIDSEDYYEYCEYPEV